MKTKEQLAIKAYPPILEDDGWDKNEQYRESFIEGWEAGQPKWIIVDNQLPKEDIRVLCKIINEDIPEILQYEVCSYYQENWYGDFNIDDKVLEWMEIPL